MAERSKGMVRCIECSNGKYMQWFRNPVICQCSIYREKFVAEAKRLCDEYTKRTNTKVEITHYDHY